MLFAVDSDDGIGRGGHPGRDRRAAEEAREPLHIKVDDRRRVEREDLREQQATDDGYAERTSQLAAGARAERERQQGMSAYDAIVQACLLRFRPIMMTTLAALFGALPLAVESGTGAELRFPLGISIIGGLLLSQLLTLYTTPVIYLALDRINRKIEKAVPEVGPQRPPVAGATEGMQ